MPEHKVGTESQVVYKDEKGSAHDGFLSTPIGDLFSHSAHVGQLVNALINDDSAVYVEAHGISAPECVSSV